MFEFNCFIQENKKFQILDLNGSTEDYLNILKLIAVGLNKLQKKNAFLSGAVEV